MGQILTSKGTVIDPEKAKAGLAMEAPSDVEGLQRLNGFVKYLAKLLPCPVDVMEPIRRLTRTEVKWSWREK